MTKEHTLQELNETTVIALELGSSVSINLLRGLKDLIELVNESDSDVQMVLEQYMNMINNIKEDLEILKNE